MATYIALCNFTDQGIRSVRDTTQRAEAVRKAGQAAGVEMTGIYWTLGAYDLVVMLQAPDQKTATAFALSIASQGNVRMQTLTGFDAQEMKEILAKMG
jgi:uncharacterized protein with GYD domain